MRRFQRKLNQETMERVLVTCMCVRKMPTNRHVDKTWIHFPTAMQIRRLIGLAGSGSWAQSPALFSTFHVPFAIQ